ncbi:MAG: amino acid adenylation domain-containing protein, partial [Acidobacteriota bacterium]|nr:amino acid adenylation domain-containing protein [Acidobacteriota bacterium]
LYNVPIALRVSGELSVAVLSRVLGEVVRRHEVLRTVFCSEGGLARQVILPPAGCAVPLVDLTGLPPALREPVVADLVTEEARRPFDLALGPLLRVRLWQLDETEHVLLLALHHIVSDGWSLGVLVREVTALYTAFSSGEPSPLPELPVQYADFAAWQRSWLSGGVLEGELAYWRERLSGAPGLLELPLDRPRPAVQSLRGRMLQMALDAELSSSLAQLARQEAATLFMVLLAAFQGLLGRLSGAPEVCVGTPIAGRTRRETEDLIGFFVNTLVLRGDLSGDPPFGEHLARVRAEALAAYAHQELPFEKLVLELAPERSLGATPLFQVFLALQNAPMGSVELPGVQLLPFALESSAAKFDLEVSLTETASGLMGFLQYDTSLFDRSTIVRLSGQLESVLRSAAASPELRLSDLALLSAAESQQILWEWRGTPGESSAVSVSDLLSNQASRTPRSVAVVWGQEHLSYGELDRRVGRLAHRLWVLGVRPETRVGLLVERSLDLVVGLLGIWRAGGAAVPLDPGQPRSRLAWLIEDALLPGVGGVAGAAGGAGMAGAAGGSALVSQRGLQGLLEELPLGEVPVAWVDETVEEGEAEPARVGRVGSVAGRDLAYLIYTSGTTGRPKAVTVEHGSLAHTLAAVQEVFGFTAMDRMPVLASPSFDIFLFELLTPLLAGGTAVLFETRPTLDLSRLAEELRTSTLLHAVPAVMRQLTARLLTLGVGCPRLRRVFVGGDAVGTQLLESMRRVFPRSQITVLYGPTEGTILALSEEGEGGEGVKGGKGREARTGSWIGRPLPGVTVEVRDRAGLAVPIGVAGELWLGGPGVARGYLGRPELTAERFVPDPLGGGGGTGRLYRTGDRVRFAAGGRLEFLGRVDQQVKVRGFRIEPAEVEAALLEYPGVREAAVLARRQGGDERLVAYVVGEGPLLSGELRRFVESRLPSPMVPGHFVRLDALPLTRHGKVDRRALAELAFEVAGGEPGSSPARGVPRSPIEELVAGLFAEVLQVERVGPQDHFFELGGHSLLATQLASRLREVLGVELPLRTLFEQPTVAGLASRVEQAARSAVDPVAPPIRRVAPRPAGELPLSFAQQRLWFIDQLEGGSLYNMPIALRLRGELSVGVLSRALEEVVRRHEVLRTVFRSAGGLARQVILPPAGCAVSVVDLRGLSKASRQPVAEGWVRQEARRPFDLGRGPLLRAGLWRLDEAEHLLLLAMHHIVSDAWSIGVLTREVTALYESFSSGRPSPLAELPVQYADFAAWQRSWFSGGVLKRELAYWRRHLAGAPPMLELPADRPRPPVQSFRGAVHVGHLSPALLRKIQALSRRQGATLFMTLLAGFEGLLGRLCGQTDFTIGTPIAGRNRLETEGLIGFFVNTLVLRADLSRDPSFREILSRVRREALDAYQHQDLPFEKLVLELEPERSLGRTPLFQAMLVLQNNLPERLEMGGVELRPLAVPSGTANFDLTLVLHETGQGLEAALEYRTDLFDRTTMMRLLGQLERLLSAAAESPEAPLLRLPLLGEGERFQVLFEWNDTGPEAQRDALLHEPFLAQAALTPDRVALVSGDEHLTYRELGEGATRLARELVALGARAEVPAGILLERGLERIVALLGVLIAGAPYLPLDPALPGARLGELLDSSGASVVITREELLARLPPGRLAALCLDRESRRGRKGCDDREGRDDRKWGEGRDGSRSGRIGSGLCGFNMGAPAPMGSDMGVPAPIGSDMGVPAIGSAMGAPASIGPALAVPGQAAYVMYTSGSTGRPKGVLIEHRAAAWYVRCAAANFDLAPTDRVLQFASISFDVSVEEIFPILAVGGRLVVFPAGQIPTASEFLAFCRAFEITVVSPATAYWHELVTELEVQPEALPEALRLVSIGGEKARPDRVASWQRRASGITLWNEYGPTETSVIATLWRLGREPWDATVDLPLGRPIRGARIHILDRLLGPLPPGVPGELAIGGAGLARGYLGEPAMTAERFVPDPFGEAGGRLYRTGDLARHRPDGVLDFLGRIDHQVKLRGFRIEPGEIELALASHAEVAEAVVVLRDGLPGGRGLVAYVVPEPGAHPTGPALREGLRAKLPAYMVPAHVVVVPALPLTPNGKLDRRFLVEHGPLPDLSPGEASWTAPRTPTEELLAGLFAEVLAISGGGAGAAGDFFELGGHSLLATQLMSRVRTAFGVELPLRAVFEQPTVAGLAREIEKASRGGVSTAAPPILPVDRGPDLPLSFAQQRLWFIDQLEGGSLYNMPLALRVSGELSVAVLTRVLGEVVRRHEVLRTIFSGSGGRARQLILPPAGCAVPLVDLLDLPPALREAVAADWLTEEARRPFDLARGPLLRARLWRLDETEHVLLLALHHIVGDGWSLGVLLREVRALYTAYSAGQPSPLSELPVQYADFAVWQRSWLSGSVLEGELAYWRERLSGAPPVLELPVDRPRPAVQSTRGAVRRRSLPATLSGALIAFSRSERATLFMTLLASLGALLSRLSGQADLTVGTAVAGRNRLEIEGLIGFFVNTLVLRPDLSGNPAITELLTRIRRETLAAHAHQDLPFEKLVLELAPERSLAYAPLFQVMLVLQNAERGELTLPGLRLVPLKLPESMAKFDLTLAMAEEERGELSCVLGYNTDLF